MLFCFCGPALSWFNGQELNCWDPSTMSVVPCSCWFDFTALGSDGELCCFSCNGYKVTPVEKRQYSTWAVQSHFVCKISVSTFPFCPLFHLKFQINKPHFFSILDCILQDFFFQIKNFFFLKCWIFAKKIILHSRKCFSKKIPTNFTKQKIFATSQITASAIRMGEGDIRENKDPTTHW